jgi:drug/metabolite transporter (DMT)-like permease
MSAIRSTGSNTDKPRSGFMSPVPYLVVGGTTCLLAQSLFWLQLVGRGPLIWPFIWGYSQSAMIELVTGAHGRLPNAALWGLLYLALAFLLWLVLERRPGSRRPSPWRRAFAGWLLLQVGIVSLAFILYFTGVLKLE